MKRKTSHWVLLALALSTVLLLAVCGASGSAAEGSQQKETITGTINRLDTDYLVLITDDGEYQVMDFGENFSVEGFSEGDDVVITLIPEPLKMKRNRRSSPPWKLRNN